MGLLECLFRRLLQGTVFQASSLVGKSCPAVRLVCLAGKKGFNPKKGLLGCRAAPDQRNTSQHSENWSLGPPTVRETSAAKPLRRLGFRVEG